jgi:hypothetical protein
MGLSQNWDWKVQNFIDRWRALNRWRAPNQWRAPNGLQSPKRWQSPNSEFGARLDGNVQLPTSLVAIGDGHLRSQKSEVGSRKSDIGSRKLEIGTLEPHFWDWRWYFNLKHWKWSTMSHKRSEKKVKLIVWFKLFFHFDSHASSLNVTVTIQFIYLDFDFLLVTLSILTSQVNRSLWVNYFLSSLRFITLIYCSIFDCKWNKERIQKGLLKI